MARSAAERGAAAAGPSGRDGRADAVSPQVGAAGVASEEMMRMLKVTWTRSGSDYSSVDLRAEFGRFGEVEDVILRWATGVQ